MIDYNEIYGVDLGTYCKIHNIEVIDLIKKVKTDIKILRNNLHYKVWEKNEDVCNPIISDIYSLLQKKEKHLKRLKRWKVSELIKDDLKSLEEELHTEVVYLDVNKV